MPSAYSRPLRERDEVAHLVHDGRRRLEALVDHLGRGRRRAATRFHRGLRLSRVHAGAPAPAFHRALHLARVEPDGEPRGPQLALHFGAVELARVHELEEVEGGSVEGFIPPALGGGAEHRQLALHGGGPVSAPVDARHGGGSGLHGLGLVHPPASLGEDLEPLHELLGGDELH